MSMSLREQMETEVNTHVEDYGDLIVQNLRTSLLIPASNLPSALPLTATIAEHDVMGEVDRYGADEGVLLAQKLRGLEIALSGTFSAEAIVDCDYTLGFDSDRVQPKERDRFEERVSSNAVVEFTSEVDNDVLYHVAGTAEAGHRDTSTGTAASATPLKKTDETNYLAEVGVLPEVTPRDQLAETIRLAVSTGVSPDDGGLKLFTSWQMYFLETDNEVDGRDIDIV